MPDPATSGGQTPESGRGEEGVRQLLRASPPDYWEGIVRKVDEACDQVRHAWLLNHEAAHLLAWATLARDAALTPPAPSSDRMTPDNTRSASE